MVVTLLAKFPVISVSACIEASISVFYQATYVWTYFVLHIDKSPTCSLIPYIGIR